jgi:hypothetical protein
MEPTVRAGEALGVAIDWRPLTLTSPRSRDRRPRLEGEVAEPAQRRQWSMVRYAYLDARRYGALRA